MARAELNKSSIVAFIADIFERRRGDLRLIEVRRLGANKPEFVTAPDEHPF